jgi:uncharacterized protein (TIGR02266 family)
MESKDRRAHPRLSLAVAVDLRSGHNFYTAHTRDISVGGLFIEAEATLPIGTRLAVDLKFLKKRVRADCEVMWALTDGDKPVGVGVRFLGLAVEDREAIEAFMVFRDPLLFGVEEESQGSK